MSEFVLFDVRDGLFVQCVYFIMNSDAHLETIPNHTLNNGKVVQFISDINTLYKA